MSSFETQKNKTSGDGESIFKDYFKDGYLGCPFIDIGSSLKNDYVPSEMPPDNPVDYLKNVRFEAQQLPEILMAQKPSTKPADSKWTSFETRLPAVGSKHAPCFNWVKHQIDRFVSTQELYKNQLSKFQSIKKDLRPKLPIYPLPSMNRLQWQRFCYGKRLESSDDGTGLEFEEDLSSLKLDEDCKFDIEDFQIGLPPSNRILFRLTMPTIKYLINSNIAWIEKYGFSLIQGCWIYALLVCLEKPLHCDMISLLRNLARSCRASRDGLKDSTGNKSIINALNLIIVIVGKFFKQTDLLDNQYE